MMGDRADVIFADPSEITLSLQRSFYDDLAVHACLIMSRDEAGVLELAAFGELTDEFAGVEC